jgi:hypothetical protein
VTSKAQEIWEELRSVVTGRAKLLDSILPPSIFLIVNALLGFEYAMWSSLAVAGVLAAIRLLRGQSLLYALGGVGGVVVAILVVQLLGRAEGYFLPSIISGGFTVLLCLISVLLGRPIVALTSHIVRRWPLDWYWHPRVRPAYNEVTWLWVAYFGLRFVLQLTLFQGEETGLLALVQLLTGWPATIILLIVSYLYGTWRLQNLAGPSVEEFKAGDEPPWEGQRRGF